MADVGLIHQGIERASERFGKRTAILAGDDQWSFARVDGLANSIARHLSSNGVQRGGRVALMTANRPEFVAAVNAIGKLGAASVLLSPAWKAREVEHALELTTPVHAVAD